MARVIKCGIIISGVKIPMTVPVTTQIYPCEGEGCVAQHKRSFYIPPEHQQETPLPTEDGVYIEEREPITYFVK